MSVPEGSIEFCLRFNSQFFFHSIVTDNLINDFVKCVNNDINSVSNFIIKISKGVQILDINGPIKKIKTESNQSIIELNDLFKNSNLFFNLNFGSNFSVYSIQFIFNFEQSNKLIINKIFEKSINIEQYFEFINKNYLISLNFKYFSYKYLKNIYQNFEFPIILNKKKLKYPNLNNFEKYINLIKKFLNSLIEFLKIFKLEIIFLYYFYLENLNFYNLFLNNLQNQLLNENILILPPFIFLKKLNEYKEFNNLIPILIDIENFKILIGIIINFRTQNIYLK